MDFGCTKIDLDSKSRQDGLLQARLNGHAKPSLPCAGEKCEKNEFCLSPAESLVVGETTPFLLTIIVILLLNFPSLESPQNQSVVV